MYLEQLKEEYKVINNRKDKREFVSSIITDSKGRVLILERCKNLFLDPGKYDFCSGHMKGNEAPMQTMYRELKEELGIKKEDIKTIEYLGDIETPHMDFLGTTTHMFHVEIMVEDIDKINERIKQTNPREIENAFYREDLKKIRRMQKETTLLRYKYTDGLEKIYQKIEKKLEDRKETKEKECEEK